MAACVTYKLACKLRVRYHLSAHQKRVRGSSVLGGKVGGLVVAVTTATALSACGSGGSTTVIEKTTVTERAAAPAETQTETTTTQEESASPSTSSAAGSSGNVTVPNVVGKDHQLAQDTMQAAGLYNLREEDATGQGRMLLYDRNWTTVKQDPPAGSKVSPNATVTLYAKKDGE